MAPNGEMIMKSRMMVNWRNPLTFEFNLKILVAFVITVIGGLAMDKLGIELPKTCVPVAGALIAGGLIFILVERHLKGRELEDVITWPVVFMVAAGQLAAAVFPGTSRSGATIIFAMICGLNRVVATELSVLIETTVHAVSWKHSDRIPLAALDGDSPGTTLVPFVRSRLALGERHFVFAPFFISAQGAIGSALRSDLETLQQEHAETPFAFTFTPGLADAGVIAQIVAARVRETIGVASLDAPSVLVVDHGGPPPPPPPPPRPRTLPPRLLPASQPSSSSRWQPR